MKHSLPFLAVPLLIHSGCFDVEGEAQLLVPHDVDLQWDSSFNNVDDGLGALVSVDVMVYDGVSGEPLEGVQLELEAGEGAVFAPIDGVAVVELADDDTVWDSYRDQYIAFTDLEPTPALALTTDVDGVARVYLYVDSFPEVGADFAAVPVLVSMGLQEESFLLLPE